MITDKEVAGQLYEAYYMKVYSFVMTLAKNKALSEEITQEVFCTGQQCAYREFL